MINKRSITALVVTLLPVAVHAQSQKAQGLLMAMGANSKQMTAHQWKQKVTVVRKGTPMDPTIEELRFDAAGQLQRTTLVKPQEKKMGPMRARKAADVKEDVQDVMQLARRYAHPEQLAQAIRKGEIWDRPGTVRVQARALMLPVDEMSILASASTFLTTRVDVKTQYEGAPVTIAIEYQTLPNGPSMMTRMTVQIPKEDIVVLVESFDFVRLAGPNAL
jgi:hypothetical protein